MAELKGRRNRRRGELPDSDSTGSGSKLHQLQLRISESLQLKGLYVANLLYGRKHLSHFH